MPIYVGGLSEAGMRRAAHHDGWIGDLYSTDEAARHAKRLAEIRDEIGADGDFRFITALTVCLLPEQFAAAEASGVTDVWTMPWAYYHGLDCTVEQKVEGIQRFAEDVIKPLS